MPRLNYYEIAPEPINKLAGVTQYLSTSSLDPRLRALVEIRVSQINGCLYCIVTHTAEARKHGETQQRLDQLPAWRESPLFDDKERAALAWAESLTHVSHTHAPDTDYEPLLEYFSEQEIVDLSVTVALMNAWNRISIGFRKLP
ncbi:MAG TPA: carboxymuconolactone decarboxylase family protein [Chthoniobacterales bacterium]